MRPLRYRGFGCREVDVLFGWVKVAAVDNNRCFSYGAGRRDGIQRPVGLFHTIFASRERIVPISKPFGGHRRDPVVGAVPHRAPGMPFGFPSERAFSFTEIPNLIDAPFVWFPRPESPAFYDRLIHECYRGGLKSPHIVQEAVNEATILSLVSHGMGVGWVNGTARWRCPERVVIISVSNLNMPLPLSLVWRKDNTSPLLASFIADVQRLPDVQALSKK